MVIGKFDSSSTHRRVVSGVDLFRQFSNVRDRVLMFGSLHDIHVVLENSAEDNAFTEKLHRAFYYSDYRQYNRSLIFTN